MNRSGLLLSLALALPLTGCVGSANFSSYGPRGPGGSPGPAGGQGGSTSPTGSGDSRPAMVPNLALMTQAEAEAALRQAGFTQPVTIDTSSSCGSTIDNKAVVELGRVCYQMPAAGRESSTGVPVSVRLQTEDPWRGSLGGGRFWFLMPNLGGVPLETAKAKLRALGFTAKEPVISYVQEPGCRPNIVCRTSPDALTRTDGTSDKVLVVGKPDVVFESTGPKPPPPPPPATPTTTPASKPADIF